MKQFLIVLLGVFVSIGQHSAFAQSLPDEVSQPYQIYQTAQEAGDLERAALAAAQAWRAAVRLDVELDTVHVLGGNAVISAAEAGLVPGIADISVEVGQWTLMTGDPESAIYVLAEGARGTRSVRDHIGTNQLQSFGMEILAGAELRAPTLLRALFVVDRGTVPDRAPLVDSVMAARNSENSRMLVNVISEQITLAVQQERYMEAFQNVEETVQQLQLWQEDDPAIYDEIFASVSVILSEGFDDETSGAHRFDAPLRAQWCDYLQRWPQLVFEEFEPAYPTRAIASGYEGALTDTGIIVPASGGRATIERDPARGQMTLFARASHNHAREFRFRPQCDASGGDIILRKLDGYSVVGRSEPGRNAVIAAQVWRVWVRVER